MEQVVIKKDAWELAYKNFLHVSYFAWVLSIIFLAIFLFAEGQMKESVNIMLIVSIFVTTFAWHFLARKFKKREKSAVTWGYVLLSILLVWNLIYGVNIIVILVLLYFIYLVYKASKVISVV